VHPTAECVSTALQRKAFGRALRVGQSPDIADLSAFRTDLEEQAERHMDN
jgi:predicted RNA-binding protein YlxR (DUF448 family)